jgi:hypothetical protein
MKHFISFALIIEGQEKIEQSKKGTCILYACLMIACTYHIMSSIPFTLES